MRLEEIESMNIPVGAPIELVNYENQFCVRNGSARVGYFRGINKTHEPYQDEDHYFVKLNGKPEMDSSIRESETEITMIERINILERKTQFTEVVATTR